MLLGICGSDIVRYLANSGMFGPRLLDLAGNLETCRYVATSFSQFIGYLVGLMQTGYGIRNASVFSGILEYYAHCCGLL